MSRSRCRGKHDFNILYTAVRDFSEKSGWLSPLECCAVLAGRKPKLQHLALREVRPKPLQAKGPRRIGMNRVVLLAATFVLSTGVMLGQSSPTATDTGRPTAAPDQTQRGDTSTRLRLSCLISPRKRRPIPIAPGAPPDTALPNPTVEDQQPGNSTTGSPSSTMGTTGSTPGTDQSTSGNKSATTPDNVQVPTGDNTQNPRPDSTEPHDKYPSGSSNPSSSANGASGNDMSGTTPRPDGTTTTSPTPNNPTPHIATHVPDPGTETNPASMELSAATKIRN